MKLSLKPSVNKKTTTPLAVKLDFSTREDKLEEKKEPLRRIAHRIESLADAVPKPYEVVIPCPYQIHCETAKEETSVMIIDPANEGKEAWAARQAQYKEEDLGPSYEVINSRSARTPQGLLSRVFDLPIVESDSNQYDKVSVEDFGAAMLRGMGIDPSDDKQCVAFYEPPKRRAFARAGIGAEKAFLLPHEKARVPNSRP